jgi:hypothetical protein
MGAIREFERHELPAEYIFDTILGRFIPNSKLAIIPVFSSGEVP